MQGRFLAASLQHLVDMQDRRIDGARQQRRHVGGGDRDERHLFGLDVGLAQHHATEHVGKAADLLHPDLLAAQVVQALDVGAHRHGRREARSGRVDGLDAGLLGHRDRDGGSCAGPGVEGAADHVPDDVDAALEGGDLDVQPLFGEEALVLGDPGSDVDDVGWGRGHAELHLRELLRRARIGHERHAGERQHDEHHEPPHHSVRRPRRLTASHCASTGTAARRLRMPHLLGIGHGRYRERWGLSTAPPPA